MKIYFPGNDVPDYLIKVIPTQEWLDAFGAWKDGDPQISAEQPMPPSIFIKYSLGIERGGVWFVRPLFTFGSWDRAGYGTGTLSADNLKAYAEPWWQYILRRVREKLKLESVSL